LTQSTYDGIIYNAEAIKASLDGHIGALLFDEAWLPHAAFHDFYRQMHVQPGLSRTRDHHPRSRDPNRGRQIPYVRELPAGGKALTAPRGRRIVTYGSSAVRGIHPVPTKVTGSGAADTLGEVLGD